MDKINLNLFGLNYTNNVVKKEETKAEEKPGKKAEGGAKKEAETGALLDAMALSGAQNLAFAGVNQINPKDYLDEESIARIQNSMLQFTGSVEKYMNLIEAEFPGLTEAQVQELALKTVLGNV